MDYSIIIPARFGSTRLPGKALLDIAGQTMIQRVHTQACASSATEVIIATDDERIAEVARRFGADVAMTRSDHSSGTDRLQEVAQSRGFAEQRIVVNVQGDEPLLPPALIDQVANNLASSNAGVATLCEAITNVDELFDSNAVKVVRNQRDLALYFSRQPLPWQRSWQAVQAAVIEGVSGDGQIDVLRNEVQQQLNNQRLWFRHIGLYGYRTQVLNDFISWPKSGLEISESLEQLRMLDNGVSILCQEASVPSPVGVDTPEDLEAIRRIFSQPKN